MQDQFPPSMVSPYASRHQVVSLHLQRWSSTPDQPTSTYGNYPGTASNPIQAYHQNGRQCRRKADLDFLAFCVLEETSRTTADDLDEDGITTSIPTGCHGWTQSTWPRTDHSGGCWQPVALRTHSGASWRRRRMMPFLVTQSSVKHWRKINFQHYKFEMYLLNWNEVLFLKI